jgi:hypothetical protein
MLAPKAAAATWLAMSCAACSLALDFGGLSALPPSYCGLIQPAARFCDDFDADAEAPFARWGMVLQENGTASLDDDAYVSPRRSFLATSKPFQQGAADVYAQAYAHVALDELLDQPLVMTLSFELQIEAFDSSADGYVTLLSFDYDRADGGHLLDLDLVPGPALYLAVGEQNIATDDSEPEQTLHGRLAGDPLAEATWYHIEYVIDIREPRGDQNWFTVSVDGEKRTTAQFAYALAGGQPDLALGITDLSAGTIDPWRLRFDNFLVQIERR